MADETVTLPSQAMQDPRVPRAWATLLAQSLTLSLVTLPAVAALPLSLSPTELATLAVTSAASRPGSLLHGRQQEPRAEPRELLVLTDAHVDAVADESTSHAHALFQMPWNHLGMTMRLRYLAGGAPDDVDPAVTRAIVLHLVGDVPAPAWLWPWLWRQRALPDLRFLHLGSLQALRNTDPEQLGRWLAGFGLDDVATQIDSPLRCVFEMRSRELCAFESTPIERRHLGPRNRSADNTVWVTTRDRRNPTDVRAPVVTGPSFAIALDPYVVTAGSGRGDRRWHLDPFAFFRTALALDGVPAPDPCVAWGRRKFVLHIDGDGFESMSSTEPGKMAAAVFCEQVMDVTPIPMTLSVIIRSLTNDIAVATPTPAMQLASRMLACPWVEAASHTVLHPLDWRRPVTPQTLPRTVLWYDGGGLANYRHDMRAEVVESVRFVNARLAAKGRPCRVMLWSGEANPTAEVVAACAEAGCQNLNGGVFRFDASQPTVGGVSPWGLRQGDTFQVYTGAANENDFDGFYTTLPTAFRHVSETIERTGSPRILKPANVYAHFYSSEQAPRLAVLKDLIAEWAFRRPTVPVFASEYAAAVTDAERQCRIERTATGFRFRGFTDCRTVRFDRPDKKRSVDWQQSIGVLGANVIEGSLYLQLAAGDAELVWTDSTVVRPHLVQADHVLADVARDADGLRLRSQAFRDRHVVVGGLPPGQMAAFTVNGTARASLADAEGRIEIALPGAGDDRIEVAAR